MSKDKLSTLMDALVNELLTQVQDGVTVADKDGNVEKISTPAAVLNVARQFLKDHNIEPSKNNDKVKTLVSSLPFDDSAPARTH